MNANNIAGNLGDRRDAILQSLSGLSDAEKTDVLAKVISVVLDPGGKGKLDASNPAERDELNWRYKVMMAPLIGLAHETAIDLLVSGFAYTLYERGTRGSAREIVELQQAFASDLIRFLEYFESHHSPQIEQASAEIEKAESTVH